MKQSIGFGGLAVAIVLALSPVTSGCAVAPAADAPEHVGSRSDAVNYAATPEIPFNPALFLCSSTEIEFHSAPQGWDGSSVLWSPCNVLVTVNQMTIACGGALI